MKFILFTTVFFLGMMAYLALGFVFWENRRSPLSKRLAIVFTALGVSWFMELIAEAFGYDVRPKYTTWFSISWWLARIMKTVPAVWLLLSMWKREVPAPNAPEQ